MRRLFALVAAGLFYASSPAAAEVRVFACEPEWAALAEEIGGDKVAAVSATHARQNPHYIRARPSLIAEARAADMIFCSGADLEVGWLPLLMARAGGDVQAGKAGNLMAAAVVPVLEKPVVLDRSLGDIHPEGNPHVHLDPRNIALVAEELTRRLAMIDAANAGFYRDRLKVFSVRWRKAMAGWEKQGAHLRGVPVVVHHQSLSYLINWLGMERVGALEPKPGIPPTAAHLEGLLKELKGRRDVVIMRTAYDPDKAAEWLAEKTGLPAIVLPYTIGGDAEAGNLFALFDRTIALLTSAVPR